MKYETLLFEMEDRIGLLTLNRPEKLNAHSTRMRRELLQFWQERQNDEARCRVLIVTGAGRAFCAGDDIDEMEDEKRPVEETAHRVDEMSVVVLLMRRAPQPIIAAVHGYAAGGGFYLAMAADIRIADPTARFIASSINIGVSGADLGSSFHFPREVKLGYATEYLFTGEPFDADTAHRIGFVNHVVSLEALIPKARALARKMLGQSVAGLRMRKEAINQGMRSASLEEALSLEKRNHVLCHGIRSTDNLLNRQSRR